MVAQVLCVWGEDGNNIIKQGPNLLAADMRRDGSAKALIFNGTYKLREGARTRGVCSGLMGDTKHLRATRGICHAIRKIEPHIHRTMALPSMLTSISIFSQHASSPPSRRRGGRRRGCSSSSILGELRKQQESQRRGEFHGTLFQSSPQHLIRIAVLLAVTAVGQDAQVVHNRAKVPRERESQKGPKSGRHRQGDASVPQSVEGVLGSVAAQATGGEPSAAERAELPAMGGEGETGVGEVGGEVEGVEVEEGADGGEGVGVVVREVDGALGGLAEGGGYEGGEGAADEREAGFVDVEGGLGSGGEGEGDDGVVGDEGVEFLGVVEEEAFFGDEVVGVEGPVADGNGAEGLWDEVVCRHDVWQM